jgi:hypothetical protein
VRRYCETQIVPINATGTITACCVIGKINGKPIIIFSYTHEGFSEIPEDSHFPFI